MVIDSGIPYFNCFGVCLALNNLGQCYSEKGMLEEATKTLEECLAAERTLLPPNHPDIGMS